MTHTQAEIDFIPQSFVANSTGTLGTTTMKNILLSLSLIFSVVAMPVNANDEQERIEIKQVSIRNHEQYMAQLKRDLPVGTSFEDVKAYLSENKIHYTYVPEEGRLYVMLRKIKGSFFIFNTDLSIKIYASEESGLSEIKYKLIHTAL